MIKKHLFINKKGFTMLEIIAVLILLSVLAAIAVPKYINMETNARKRILDAGMKELNAREHLAWSDQKISPSGYVSDARVYGVVSYEIGIDYTWNAGDPTPLGGTLIFDDESVSLSRSPSNGGQPAHWTKNP
ncbi:MAG: type II secretion system protein [Desulfobacterales bacterium]|jgi:prepilin-type N-terminal cleavage/methylation domain-containing protein